MAKYYIDPTWAGAENGTEAEPFASWPALTEGNEYLGKGGTTSTLSAILNLTTPRITLGTYPEDLSLGKHTINGASAGDPDRVIRIAATAHYPTIKNLDLDMGGNKVNGITSNAGSVGGTIYGCDLRGGEGHATNNNQGISWQSNSPFEIRDNTITGFNSGVWLGNNAITAYSSIHHNTIANTPHPDAHTFASAMAILGGIDCAYNLHIHDNDLSGWLENAIDLVGASNVYFYSNECWGNRYSPTNQSAILCGATDGSIGGSRIYANYIHDITHIDTELTNYGINTRGGVNIESVGNLIVNCDGGIVTSSVSTGCSFDHESIINCRVGVKNSIGTNTLSNSLITGTTGDNSIDISAGTLTVDHSYYDKTASGITDGGNNTNADEPLLNADYSLPTDSPLVGSGGSSDSSINVTLGEPFPMFDIDIGAMQSTHGPFHPINL